jgi:hypothetical protein
MSKGRTVPEQPQASQLVFDIPEPSAPGFLRRQRDAVRYREALRTTPNVQTMNDMIDFLLTFVAEPADRNVARELLLDISRDEYNRVLQAVNAEDPDFLGNSFRDVSSSQRS